MQGQLAAALGAACVLLFAGGTVSGTVASPQGSVFYEAISAGAVMGSRVCLWTGAACIHKPRTVPERHLRCRSGIHRFAL